MNAEDFVQPMIEITQEEYKELLKAKFAVGKVNDYIHERDLKEAEKYGVLSLSESTTLRLLTGYVVGKDVMDAIEKYQKNNNTEDGGVKQ